MIAGGGRRTKALAIAAVGGLLVLTAVNVEAAGWTVVTSPNVGTSSSLSGSVWTIVSTTANLGLDGVRCRSTTFCMAVGAQDVGANTDTLAEKWNGTTWSVLTTPNASGSPGNILLSVSCTGATFCMAGGYAQGSGVTQKTLTEVWNGSTWAIVPSVSPTSDSVINSVSCTTETGGNFCLAVGESTGKTLVEKYS